MEDNYRFLREKNLDELYACVCEVENLYKKGMYKQIPQECRKALEIEIYKRFFKRILTINHIFI